MITGSMNRFSLALHGERRQAHPKIARHAAKRNAGYVKLTSGVPQGTTEFRGIPNFWSELARFSPLGTPDRDAPRKSAFKPTVVFLRKQDDSGTNSVEGNNK